MNTNNHQPQNHLAAIRMRLLQDRGAGSSRASPLGRSRSRLRGGGGGGCGASRLPQVPEPPGAAPPGLSGGQRPPGGARAGRERRGEPCAEGTASMGLKNHCSSGGGLGGDAMPGLRGRAALSASPLRLRPRPRRWPCLFSPAPGSKLFPLPVLLPRAREPRAQR